MTLLGCSHKDECNFKNKKVKDIQMSLRLSRDRLYDNLPTGEVDAFALITLINEHIKELDKLIEEIER